MEKNKGTLMKMVLELHGRVIDKAMTGSPVKAIEYNQVLAYLIRFML